MTNRQLSLPQLGSSLFVTDGGLETTLIFRDGLDIPFFAAFSLLRSQSGREALSRYYIEYLQLAQRHGCGIILESPTWRANPEWGWRLGYALDELAAANRDAIALLGEVIEPFQTATGARIRSGCIGPRGDGYIADRVMPVTEALAYHEWQIGVLATTEADMVCAMTMTTAEEATGVALAAQKHDMPVAISFTTETDGLLPSGQALGAAINQVDDATVGYPAYYMINCAHPDHFRFAFEEGKPWLQRLRGVRANASRKSHAELDASENLDDGDPVELGKMYAEMHARHRGFSILGGCCGTDTRHIDAIAATCMPLFTRLSN
ncbi:homocysteine S-methyltransferase family protein [Acidovorax sp. JHL-9]|uniref:homocysteine S-methyltransferase family protein n=1 Tax=Acidovorax sp. JHL-9 TaxID=1276756 RepID=UPI00047E5232|nr:homocysteine S-methyltransferase family protein [Acidovorax sp. JHL-9]